MTWNLGRWIGFSAELFVVRGIAAMFSWKTIRDELREAAWLASVIGGLSVLEVLAAAGLALLT